jgi:hypothetical protein
MGPPRLPPGDEPFYSFAHPRAKSPQRRPPSTETEPRNTSLRNFRAEFRLPAQKWKDAILPPTPSSAAQPAAATARSRPAAAPPSPASKAQAYAPRIEPPSPRNAETERARAYELEARVAETMAHELAELAAREEERRRELDEALRQRRFESAGMARTAVQGEVAGDDGDEMDLSVGGVLFPSFAGLASPSGVARPLPMCEPLFTDELVDGECLMEPQPPSVLCMGPFVFGPTGVRAPLEDLLFMPGGDFLADILAEPYEVDAKVTSGPALAAGAGAKTQSRPASGASARPQTGSRRRPAGGAGAAAGAGTKPGRRAEAATPKGQAQTPTALSASLAGQGGEGAKRRGDPAIVVSAPSAAPVGGPPSVVEGSESSSAVSAATAAAAAAPSVLSPTAGAARVEVVELTTEAILDAREANEVVRLEAMMDAAFTAVAAETLERAQGSCDPRGEAHA